MKRYFCVFALFAIAGCHHEVVVPGGTVSTDASGQLTKVQTKDGSIEVNGDKVTSKGADGSTFESNATVTEGDLGMPFYPGSIEAPGSMKASKDNKTLVTSSRTTTDSAKKVLEFYAGKLGAAKQTTESPQMSVGSWEKDGKKIAVIISTADGKSTIQISSSNM